MSEPNDEHAARVNFAQKAAWWLQAFALSALWWLARHMSPERASATGARLMTWLGPRTRKHRHVRANLRMVCPEKSPPEIECLARAAWGNLGAVLAEYALLDLFSDAERNRERLEFVNHTGDPDFFERPKPCVFVSVHLAQWELVAYTGNRFGGGMDAVYNPQPNPWLEKLVQRQRQSLGAAYVGKLNSARRLLRALKSGRSVGLLIDVRIDDGVMAPFCGADATVTTLPAWLSLSAGCDIVPVQVERLPATQFRITLHPALRAGAGEGESRDEAILRVTRELNAVAERWIKAYPGHWLCTKRRWPKEIMKARGVYSD